MKGQALLRLREVQSTLQRLAVALTTADKKELPGLYLEAQRNRVAMLMLKEITTDLADPTTYRELTLLNKLVTGQEEGDDEESAAAASEAVGQRLAEAGISPGQADGMVRVLDALKSVMLREEMVPPKPVPPPLRDLKNGDIPRPVMPENRQLREGEWPTR